MEPNLKHLINKQLKWIFVGGKGGVGKTTTSCALGILLSKYRENVLIVSTDPAHNLSDSFDQKLTSKPTLIKGFKNLFAMEIDPTSGLDQTAEELVAAKSNSTGFSLESLGLNDLLGALPPGVDEAVSFGEVMKLVQNFNYSVVIFDTAPTGHTLRLLSFPFTLQKSLDKIKKVKDTLLPLFDQLKGLLGLQSFDVTSLVNKIESSIPVINEISEMLKDPKRCTFVCVCIAEFLSMYETERLITQLTDMNINVNSLVVNQLVNLNAAGCANCETCKSRAESQEKYLVQMEDLYSSYHFVKAYLLPFEVRGVDRLNTYSQYLMP